MSVKKSAIISIVGKPNVGKSTLLNRLVGTKIAIVSNKPQTTRTRITGVVTKGDCQFVFQDTPGLHKPRSRLGDYMVKVVNDTVTDVDIAAMVVDPVPHIGPAEQELMERMKQYRMPSVLVINKIDTVKNEDLLAVIAAYSEAHTWDAVVPLSAKTGEGIPLLLEKLEELAAGGKREALLKIPSGKLGLISKLYTDAQILELNYTGDGAEVRAILDAATYGRLKEYITGDEGFTNDEE